MPGDDRPRALNVALQILGAAAGLATLATLVGGATLWLRFAALDLPADQAVAQLPKPLLTLFGVHALALPVVVGLAVALIVAGMDPLDDEAHQRPRKRFWLVYALIVAGGVLYVVLGLEGGDIVDDWGPMALALAVALAVLLQGAVSPAVRGRHLALMTFGAFVFCGAAQALVRAHAFPVMEPVALLLTDEKKAGVAGFYVGRTSDHVYVASLPGSGARTDPFADAPADSVLEIPRAEIRRMVMRRPVATDDEAPGRDQAATLLTQLLSREGLTPPAQRPVMRDPVHAFAPLVHLHAGERYWPTTVGAFLAGSTLRWRHGGHCPDHRVAATIDANRLGRGPTGGGSDPYAHAPSDADCAEPASPLIPSTAITRPNERTRAAGVPVAQGFYLQADAAATTPKAKTSKSGGQTLLGGVPAYYENHLEGAGPQRRITYWLFYGYSLPPGSPKKLLAQFAHQGDWERVSVLVEPVDAERWAMVSVRYHFHNESRDVPWPSVPLTAPPGGAVATHPVAYSALGSHASYPRAGDYVERRLALKGEVHATDRAMACSACPQWRTWDALVDATEQGWYGFGGAWGRARGSSDTTGPLGPSAQKTVGVAPATTG